MKYQVYWTFEFKTDVLEMEQDFDTEELAGHKLSDVLSSANMLGIIAYLKVADIREIV